MMYYCCFVLHANPPLSTWHISYFWLFIFFTCIWCNIAVLFYMQTASLLTACFLLLTGLSITSKWCITAILFYMQNHFPPHVTYLTVDCISVVQLLLYLHRRWINSINEATNTTVCVTDQSHRRNTFVFGTYRQNRQEKNEINMKYSPWCDLINTARISKAFNISTNIQPQTET